SRPPLTHHARGRAARRAPIARYGASSLGIGRCCPAMSAVCLRCEQALATQDRGRHRDCVDRVVSCVLPDEPARRAAAVVPATTSGSYLLLRKRRKRDRDVEALRTFLGP